jgi:hypothetical protein
VVMVDEADEEVVNLTDDEGPEERKEVKEVNVTDRGSKAIIGSAACEILQGVRNAQHSNDKETKERS